MLCRQYHPAVSPKRFAGLFGGFFGVPFKFVINILKLLTYPGTYYEQCFAFKMTKISLGRYLNRGTI